ncbi:ferrous iron transport protein B [Leptospira sp. 2 VSF19]|uniref:Ferrous iron transport protein B n=1 Tax=Leptospira soteropolitanensis TaxID=2950025 RepID=A0AAW5VT38_9LEPT|nr:ferrous iron transport protein B [Leptospira soteropolitanensis]MCW7494151.1 ferrous iron transport protein B [Leptospira soteropolitanensis]MCW7501874.1 ferrous iron transport protein B [Leptospira soteropolitanensis]MCW7523997.1 ferrous iron transport protein B [Leptospira soteropolitanensis]MCW7527862.1 ferrous iron transport protein B [Leptospira soteropolitanensis]MCW7531844.1 ferrous iron transport protein B [Leptospira soteropolitanensis]
MKQNRIYLVGNPNCGKSTLFNQLTGLKQKTGNFSGVTVEKREGTLNLDNVDWTITDLPGTYGLGGVAEDKKIAYEILLSRTPDEQVIYVLDALNLERGLQFLLQIIDMGVPTLVVLTMKDVLEKKRIQLDLEKLEKSIGLQFILVNAKSGEGIDHLKEILKKQDSFQKRPRLWNWDSKEESFLAEAKQKLGINTNEAEFFLSQSLKFINKDPHLNDKRYFTKFPEETGNWLKSAIEGKGYNFYYQEEMIHRSFFIKKVLANVITYPKSIPGSWEEKLDRLLLHPILGFVCFFLLMGLLFQSLFSFAELPMDLIESGITSLQSFVESLLSDGLLKSLICEGIIGGVGSVIVFIPQIALLFLFIGILEESGYLARASFLMDRVMGKFGLSGKSFIPLLSSAACAVPAILGTRTIENKSDRFTTIMVSPLIMCSARYPVYILIVGTVFSFPPVFGIFNIQGFVLFSMFSLGMIASLGFALLFRKTVFKEDASYFVMELPRYNLPSARSLFHTVFAKVKSFLSTAGQIILYISVLLWFLSHFPADYKNNEWKTSPIENSYIGTIGKVMEPAIKPLGFDWKIGISILTSFAAREVMVSTLAVLYGSEENEEGESLRSMLRTEKREDGSPVWTPLSGLSLLVFFAFASQCMSTLAVTKKETGTLFWPVVQFLYMTTLAICSSFLIFQLGKILGFS